MKKSTRDLLWTLGGSAVAVLLLGACFGPSALPGPVVYVRTGEGFNLQPVPGATKWTSEDLKWIERGITQWSKLGFDVRINETVDTTLPPEDVLVIDLYRDANLVNFAGLSDRPRRRTFVNATLKTYDLMATTAHEIGHHILNSAEHLPAGAVGVMTSGSNSWSLTEADFELACRVSKRCDRF